jgi:NAD(P)-dependent dehydrogenase (short-subunit alcohol dehydrogenase family)
MATLTSQFGARSTALDVAATQSLVGRRALVTGGASGLGFETSLGLASAGAHVTLAVRNLEQGETAAATIRKQFADAEVAVAFVDLSDLSSCKHVGEHWSTQPLDILINNAAIMACPLTRSPQGWEAQFATNHLGHFVLTNALLPSLLQAADKRGEARVVCLTSSGHKIASVDFDDIHFDKRAYNKWIAYGQAKSANAIMSLGLHLRYGTRGIVSNAVHPGGIMTGLQKFLPIEEMRAMGWLKADDTPLDIFKTPQQGAATSVWAAMGAELHGHGGLYLEDCRQGVPAEKSNRVSGYSPHVADPEVAERLWTVSETMVA